MAIKHPNDIIIHGTTTSGKVFRPSDWAERLCGILSSFNKDHRLAYHEWVNPVLIEKVRCVAVDAQLEEVNPAMFKFLMDFAADNDLRVMRAADLEAMSQGENVSQGVQASVSVENIAEVKNVAESVVEAALNEASHEVDASILVKQENQTQDFELCEILPEDTATAFNALGVLRPHLVDVNQFVNQVNKTQRAEGYRMLGVFETGKTQAVAVCGFRVRTNLASGKHLHIDDLITVPQCRSKGYANLLLDRVYEIAKQEGASKVQAASNVGGERASAHRLYFDQGFAITAHHFVRFVEN